MIEPATITLSHLHQHAWGTRHWRKRDYVERCADEGHYLNLPPDIPYALTRYNAGQSIWEYDPLMGMVRR